MKYTLNEAREVLGVSKESSKYDIEKKYDILMKKYQLLKADGLLDEKAESDFKESTEAYRILMGYEVDEPKLERDPNYADKVFQKAGIDKKKTENFFYYHKVHILISIFAIIVIGVIVRSFVVRVDPDISIGFIGEVNSDEFTKVQEQIIEKLPEIKAVGIDSAIYTNNYVDPQEYANLSKIMVLLSVSDTDLFIMNKCAYDNYAKDGPFMELEDVAKKLNIDTSKSEHLKLRVVDEYEKQFTTSTEERKVLKYRDEEPKLYGIDVTHSKFFEDIGVIGPEKILVIKLDPENEDLVLKLVKLFSE